MFKNSFSFSGRITRTEFGVSYVIAMSYLVFVLIIAQWLEVSEFMILPPLIAMFWFLYAQGAKRCHDMGRSGYYQLIPFYFFAMIIGESQNKTNRYGPNPKLVELQESLSDSSEEIEKFIFPKERELKILASEIITSVLLSILSIAIFRDVLALDYWFLNVTFSILLMAGYYLALLFYKKRVGLFQWGKFFIFHRALFCVVFFILNLAYMIYSHNITEFTFLLIGSGLFEIFSLFTLTFLPFLIFKTAITSNPSPVEV